MSSMYPAPPVSIKKISTFYKVLHTMVGHWEEGHVRVDCSPLEIDLEELYLTVALLLLRSR